LNKNPREILESLRAGEHLSQMNIIELFYRLVFYEQLIMFDHHINLTSPVPGINELQMGDFTHFWRVFLVCG
jgi:hypothetical protein